MRNPNSRELAACTWVKGSEKSRIDVEMVFFLSGKHHCFIFHMRKTSHLAFIAPERSCSPQWCGEAFSPQTAIQPLAFSGPRYAEFYLGADSAAAWGARGDKEQSHPTPAFAPSRLPSGPAAISRRRAAPSALRLVPLADSGAGVRLHATF